MTPYEATYSKLMVKRSPFSGKEIPCPVKDVIANLINSIWIYSMYWKNSNYQWIKQAKVDLKTELEYANERIDQLKQAEQLLNSIKDE